MNRRGFWKTIGLVSVLCALPTIDSPAETFTILKSFNGTDGASPSGLFQGFYGDLYGKPAAAGLSALAMPAAMARCSTSPRGTVQHAPQLREG